MSIINKTIPIILSLVLSACGGSTDGGSNTSNNANTDGDNSYGNQTPELTLTLESNAVSINESENNTVNITTNYTGSSSLSYSVNIDNGASVEISVSDQVLSIEASTVDADIEVDAEIVVTDGELSASQSLTISVINIPNLMFDLDVTEVSLEENSSTSVKLHPVEVVPDVTYSISFDHIQDAIATVIENNELILSANELDNDYVGTLSIVANHQSKDLSYSQTLPVELLNSSMKPVKAWASMDKVFEFDDFNNIPAFYAKTAYLHKAVSYSGFKSYIAEFDDLLAHAKSQKQNIDSQSFIDAISKYDQNEMTETEVKATLSSFKSSVIAEYDLLIQKLNELSELFEGQLPLLSIGQFNYLPEFDSFSGIVGDEKLGAFIEGEWRFSDENKVLEKLLPVLGVSDCPVSEVD
ncbi:hypothetical protein [uncultured Pseudoalteromonas sp.]|mgnify:FL=1|jgi:hypothetical protein|uniref:hypothetical protein n=1 Tax=Pseudoalteromonas tetraodonis TaxID=43659 RepID=UPI0032B11437